MKLRSLLLGALCVFGHAWNASAQSGAVWDASGNNLLNGTYNFRQLIYRVGNEDGFLDEQVALTGKLEFDGQGNYTMTAQVKDSQFSDLRTLTKTGTYAIAANGFGYLSSTIFDSGKVFGLVSQGIFMGSSTEEVANPKNFGINDLLIAAPAASPAQTNASLSGRYWVVDTNFPGFDPSQGRDAFFQLNPDGNGNVGTVNARGYIGFRTRAVTQTINNASYSFTNGVGRLSYGGTLSSTNLLAGDRVLFLSPDGNFVFGGTLEGWDMFIGMRALPENATSDTAKGLFYQAGLSSYVEDGYAEFYSYYGSLSFQSGFQVNHQRVYTGFDIAPYDYIFGDPVDLASDGGWDDFIGFHNIVGAGGNAIIGYGLSQAPGLWFALKAPSFSGSGVYLDPTGIKNAAGNAPFTQAISKGELLALGGTGLADGASEDTTFPTTLGGVQVLINGQPSPIQSVSAERVVAIVPYSVPEGIAKIQVINRGTESNAVTVYVNRYSSPGPFTVPEGGYGLAKARHADGTDLTADSPARIGEIVSILVSGLGELDLPVLEGTPGPDNPRAKVKDSVVVRIEGQRTDVMFAGLAPGMIGVYQIDFVIPAGTEAGENNLSITTADSVVTRQVRIPVR